jgi:hypothetical protein
MSVLPNENPADRVILISLMKSGTHLITRLMTALGYRLYGHVRVTPDTRPALDVQTRWRLASMIYDHEFIANLKSQPESAFNDATDHAWEALAWSWQLRFGMPLSSWYSRELVDTGLVEQVHRQTAGSSFSETPAGICWVLHEFDVSKIDGAFLNEWAETGTPRIIFHYRDPRDITLSMVNFLSKKTKNGLSAFNSLQVFSGILLGKDSLEDRLTYALTDKSFPCNEDDFMRMYWMLNHPNVCTTSFEELVGPDGGGSAESQRRATARLIEFLGASGSADDVKESLFNRDTFSFFRGEIGAWRDVFTEDHRRLAEARFGDVLKLYGYA